ncbi:hypothetical protein V5O48_009210, partial [Marasmius crinis-equi]
MWKNDGWDRESDRRASCTSKVQSLCLDTPDLCLNPLFEGLLPYIDMPNLKSLRLWGEPGSDEDTYMAEDEECLLDFIH